MPAAEDSVSTFVRPQIRAAAPRSNCASRRSVSTADVYLSVGAGAFLAQRMLDFVQAALAMAKRFKGFQIGAELLALFAGQLRFRAA